MQGETVFLLLFIVATAVAIAARRLQVPYTVALVLAGLALGPVHAFEPPHLTKELLFSLVLPGLLFEAAFHLEFQDFWRDRNAILALAVPGVIATIAITTLLLTPMVGALSLADDFDWRRTPGLRGRHRGDRSDRGRRRLQASGRAAPPRPARRG